jgi:hypothetical protein
MQIYVVRQADSGNQQVGRSRQEEAVVGRLSGRQGCIQRHGGRGRN